MPRAGRSQSVQRCIRLCFFLLITTGLSLGVSTHPKGGRGGALSTLGHGLPAGGLPPIGVLRTLQGFFAEPRPPATVQRSPFSASLQRRLRYEDHGGERRPRGGASRLRGVL